MKKKYSIISLFLLLLLFSSCSTLLKIPDGTSKPKLGQKTDMQFAINKLPPPKEKIVVGVYKFRDQTGQYKPTETGSSFSTAIPQGITSILIKALEDSDWFIPIERENVANLLNERQIIRTTKQEYSQNQNNNNNKNNQSLPPLLFAGVLLEGGVISYDTNVLTGGLGARYFGIGASTQYRQDRISVYLRAVSTLNGKILKSVYVDKTILSTTLNGSIFKYVDTERLLESEVGITQNEPVQIAVKQAIEKAVQALIIEGISDKIWEADPKSTKETEAAINAMKQEQTQVDFLAKKADFYDTKGKHYSIYGLAEGNMIQGDYENPVITPGVRFGLKYQLNRYWNINASTAFIIFENKDVLRKRYMATDLNLEYLMLPANKFSPFIFGGGGFLKNNQPITFKYQVGGGFEYFLKDFSLRLQSQYDFGLEDTWDDITNGKYNDRALKFGFGLTYHFRKK